MKWLTKTQDPSVVENDEARQDLARTAWFIGCGLAVGFVLVGIQQVGPRSIAAAWSAAWLAFGAIVGFLFGIPRVLQEPSRIESTSPTDSTSGTSVPAPYRLSVNTNFAHTHLPHWRLLSC
jgi:hypothetical protein